MMGFKEVMDRASAGDPAAQNALGYIYYRGDGTAVDYNRAFIWFDMAAKQGDPEGECNTAYMYVHALGTNANITRRCACTPMQRRRVIPRPSSTSGTCTPTASAWSRTGQRPYAGTPAPTRAEACRRATASR